MEYFGLDMIVTDLQEINETISKGKIRIAYPDKNRRKFDIPKSAFEKAMPTLLGAPVVAYFFGDGELGGHSGDLVKSRKGLRRTGEPMPYGFVSSEKPYWETYNDKEYFCTNVYIWTTRYKEASSILTASQSMEILIKDGGMVDGYMKINDFVFIGLCALNTKGISPTFEDSQFEKFSNSDEVKLIKEDIEKYMIGIKHLLSVDWLSELVEEISEVYGYECTDKDTEDLYDEFSCCYEESFAIPEKYKHINFKPPIAVAKQAQRGMNIRAKQSDSNKCCTPVGLVRGKQLVNRQELSPKTLKRMKSYFDRHESDKNGEGWGSDSKGYQAWLYWGGDAGYRWAKKVVGQMEKADGKEKMSIQDEPENFAESINVSTDPKKLIEGNVGEKDLAAIKRKVLSASNRNEIIKKIFAKHPSDLSGDITQSDLGYPLMSERDGTFYYNTGFIKAASSRIEQQKDQSYYDEVRRNIVKARESVGMPEKFNLMEGGTVMDMMKNMAMMEKMAMDMYAKYGMRYMPYAMDEKHMYAMDTEKDMAKMMIPYAMMEDETMAMDYEKMMAMDYGDMEMALKTAMGVLKGKLMEMNEEKMGMMEKYSTAETELTETKEKLEKYSDMEKTFDEEKAKALSEMFSMKTSIEEKDTKIKELEEANENFSVQLKGIEEEKKSIEVGNILEKTEFSIFDETEIAEFKTMSKEMPLDAFEEKLKAKAFSKYIASETFSMPESGGLNRMGAKQEVDNTKEEKKHKDVFSKLED